MKATIRRSTEVDDTNEIRYHCNKKEEWTFGYKFKSNHVQKNNWNNYVETYKCSCWSTAYSLELRKKKVPLLVFFLLILQNFSEKLLPWKSYLFGQNCNYVHVNICTKYRTRMICTKKICYMSHKYVWNFSLKVNRREGMN